MRYFENELDQLRYEDCLNDWHMSPDEENGPRDPDIIDEDEDEEEEFVELVVTWKE